MKHALHMLPASDAMHDRAIAVRIKHVKEVVDETLEQLRSVMQKRREQEAAAERSAAITKAAIG